MHLIQIVAQNNATGYVSGNEGSSRRVVRYDIDFHDVYEDATTAFEDAKAFVDENGKLNGALVGNWVVTNPGPYAIYIVDLVPVRRVDGATIIANR